VILAAEGWIDKCTKQLAVHAATNARFLFNQPGTDLFFATTVLKKKDPGNPGGTMTEIQEGVITPIQKCIVLFATAAVTNVKFPSNRQAENRFIANSVLRKVAVRTTKIPNNLRNSLINYTSSLTRF